MRRFLFTATAVLVFAAAASSASADTSLVGQWHLDEGSGTVASDSSGYGNNGTVLGGAAWVPGRFGSALSFDGRTGAVQVGNSPSLEPPSAVSVSAWVKDVGKPGAYRYIVAKGENRCYSASYGLYTGSSGGLEFYVYNGLGVSYVLSPDAGTSVWDGAWHLVVGTYDGTGVRLFVDGAQVAGGTPRLGPIPYALGDSNDLFIGNYPAAENDRTCPVGGWPGLIDEVNIWSRALSSQEVTSLMPQTPGGFAGGGQTPSDGGPSDGSGSSPGSGPGAGDYDPPQVESFKVSASAAGAHGGATISYTLTRRANLSFNVLLARTGTVRAGRCVKVSKGDGTAHHQRCTRLVTLARFSRTGHAGINHLRFAASVWRKLAPRRYTLAATPSANGQTGTTVTTTFTVRR